MSVNVSGIRGRNTVLEIFRLCASLWVMYYHGLSLIDRSEMFRNGRIAVDFFFILSGFFVLKSFDKEEEKNYFKGLKNFFLSRIKPILFTFFVCFIFQLISYIQFYEGFFENSIWGYLWYIPHMIFVFCIYFTIYRLSKSRKVFNTITAIISLFCYALVLTYLTDYGIFRGIAGIGMGILISQLPRCNHKFYNKGIVPMLTLLIFALIVFISIIHPSIIVQDYLCLLILFPSLVYFSSQIEFRNQTINNVCSISLGLYMYQTFASLLEDNLIIVNGKILFLLVLALALLDRMVFAFYTKIKIKKRF